MRIILDLQSCQAANLCSDNGNYNGQAALSLAKAIARCNEGGEHDIRLALNSRFDGTIEAIRAAFADAIPPERIHVFEVPGPVAERNPANAWRSRAAEQVREHFLASLQPDIVLIPDLFHGLDDEGVTPPEQSDARFDTVVALFEIDSLRRIDEDTGDPVAREWRRRKLHTLRHAARILTLSGEHRNQVQALLGVTAERVVDLGMVFEAGGDAPSDPTRLGEDAGAIRLLEALHDLHRSRTLAQATSPMTPAKRPRLAYVSPLPPEQTGIADYSAELLPALAQYYDIEVVTTQAMVADTAADFPLRTPDWFAQHAEQFDRIVYHFGNSQFHVHMFDLLQRHPGVVVLHDFFLGGAQYCLEASGTAPGAVVRALYESHGYQGLIEERRDRAAVLWDYPCNKAVLDQADGIIVHSQFSRSLAESWHGPGASQDWKAIPLPRAMPQPLSRSEARARIMYAECDFLVCSFGMLGPSKSNMQLLEAWLETPLAQDPGCQLLFVGANDEGDYGRDLLDAIAASGCPDRIRITGYTSPEMYHAYLAASDVGVQLRSLSRGETSAAILDCLAHGVATIVNANGAANELPDDVLHKLPDRFSRMELSAALTLLHADTAGVRRLGERAAAYIQTMRQPGTVARMYFEAIEDFSRKSASAAYRRLIGTLAELPVRTLPQRRDLQETARSIAANRPRRGLRQLLVDVSAIVQLDYKTGIQRVVRSILTVLINKPPAGYRVEPVYSTGHHYMYARKFTLNLIDVPDFGVDDAPIETAPGDMFLGLDFFSHGVTLNHRRFLNLHERGVTVYFVVYDILPILLPDAFSECTDAYHSNWLKTISAVADGLICISRAVADELADWLEKNAPPRHTDLQIGYFHLGADIVASIPTTGLTANAAQIERQMQSAPTILMVGTLEPRKGHALALSAFELLWAEGIAVNLVIVGKNGWMVHSLAQRLDQHAENGKRLFWLDDASDEMLMRLYENASALLAASEGEGFGLPLIEAAQHRLPIIARDLPVFREVAEQHAFYFSGDTPDALAAALKSWLQLHRSGTAPVSTGMQWFTWEESAMQLLEVAQNKRWYRHCAAKQAHEDQSPQHQLLVDVSSIACVDLKTGIERMVRAQLQALMRNPPAGYRVEPVYLTDAGGKWHYRYAQEYKKQLAAGDVPAMGDGAVTVSAHDVFYAPDYFPGGVAEANRAGLYAEWKKAGVELNFLVHDILPVLRPEFFPPQADALHGRWLDGIADQADRLICVSAAVAEETATWLRGRARNRRTVTELRVLHHGADIAASAPSAGMPDSAAAVLHLLSAAPSFLMVGTIEPRKGHLQTLAAFEQLWSEGRQVNLVIVGKEGWIGLEPAQRRTIPAIVDRLQNHPELGKRLFWLQGISDEYLEHIYATSACLLAPSEGEGFGLPLIESARHTLPIIARDLPVFREVAHDHALYFSGLAASDLRDAIVAWMELRAQGAAPSSAAMTWRTWAQNTDELCAILFAQAANRHAA